MYTKGPWNYCRYGNYAYDIIGENESIAIVNKQQNPDHNNETNAKLIAAAPDLLEACQKTLEALDGMTTRQFQCGADKPFREMLFIAIQKATA